MGELQGNDQFHLSPLSRMTPDFSFLPQGKKLRAGWQHMTVCATYEAWAWYGLILLPPPRPVISAARRDVQCLKWLAERLPPRSAESNNDYSWRFSRRVLECSATILCAIGESFAFRSRDLCKNGTVNFSLASVVQASAKVVVHGKGRLSLKPWESIVDPKKHQAS